MSKALAGEAQTVLGLVDGNSLGITLVHEHLLNDHSRYFKEPAKEIEKKQAWRPLGLENLYLVRLNPFCNRDNLINNDVRLAIKEALIFKSHGGNTIVECTCGSVIGRDPEGLVNIARQTGLNIIMGTGYYMADAHPANVAKQTEREIADALVRDLTVGIGDTGIKAGILGEIGCSTPLAENERKVLHCCAAAQRETGVAIYIHPGPSDEVAWEITQVLREAGADLSRVIIGHIDLFNISGETSRKIMDAGCCIGFDSFGNEGFYQIPLTSRYLETADINRVRDIVELVKEGYLSKILVSQDVGTKERLTSFAGSGYAHILRDVVPIMQVKGLSDSQIHTLLVDNPKRIISMV